MSTFSEWESIVLALTPAGGVVTMGARQAALAARMLRARAVIPMHWGTFPVLSQNMDEFERELADRAPDCRCIRMSPGQTMETAS